MMSTYRGVCIYGKYAKNSLPVTLSAINCPTFNDNFQQVRGIRKHYDPKFKKFRAEKFRKVELPVYDKEGNLTEEQQRSNLKKFGILPSGSWYERPKLITCTPQILESYVVPEGDGKFSTLTVKGAKQKAEFVEKKSKSLMAIRTIKSYDHTFTTKDFPDIALEIYKKAHEALPRMDINELLQYVTEHAYPIITHNLQDKTIVWKFIESLEPAHVVHVRKTHLITNSNEFAQITVRFHTKQILCIYDRFGRVLMGSEEVEKDVLDYVVFEKHLSNVYGMWRIHAKIIPSWMNVGEVASKTFIMPKEEDQIEPSAVESKAETVSPKAI